MWKDAGCFSHLHILFLYRRPRKEMRIYSLAGICFYKLRKPNEF